MKTRRLKDLILMMIASFFVLFSGASLVQAADEEVPTACTTKAGWEIILDGDPVFDEGNGYIWSYIVLDPNGNTPTKLNHINFNIPALDATVEDPYGIITVREASGTLATYLPGAGDPTTYFGKGILQYYVAKFTPQQGVWSFASNSGKMETGTVALKINNSLELCKIAVPSNPSFAAMAVSSEQEITTTDNKKFKIVEDPYTQCILKAQYWDGDSWEDMTKSDIQTTLKIDEGGYSEYAEYFGVPGQGCPRAIIKREGEHTWYFISGRYVWR
jgi:hypothetical protein